MAPTKKSSASEAVTDAKRTCGLIMPISAIDGCDEAHWEEVRSIITDALSEENFDVKLVSDADEVGIIQQRIVRNLYDSEVIVCDVSAKNPNVMFELGMRLAFDKPTVVIKDNETDYSFDTSPVEHLTYPRDLRFSKIVKFKNELRKKVVATSKSRPDSSFLSSFGSFKVPKINEVEVPGQEYIIEQLSRINSRIDRLSAPMRRSDIIGRERWASNDFEEIDICLMSYDLDNIKASAITEEVLKIRGVTEARLHELSDGHSHLFVTSARPSYTRHKVYKILEENGCR